MVIIRFYFSFVSLSSPNFFRSILWHSAKIQRDSLHSFGIGGYKVFLFSVREKGFCVMYISSMTRLHSCSAYFMLEGRAHPHIGFYSCLSSCQQRAIRHGEKKVHRIAYCNN